MRITVLIGASLYVISHGMEKSLTQVPEKEMKTT
jgi:hypothetical protein